MYKEILLVLIVGMSYCHGDQECEEIMVPMCRGLVGYTHTRLPNKFGNTTQAQVYRTIEQYWSFMDSNCEKNFRLTVCGLFLPKCTTGSDDVELPCRETCFRAKRSCRKKMKQNGSDWPNKELKCGKLRRRRQGRCLRPVRRRLTPAPLRFAYCETNTFSVCQNISQNIRTLPNMFLQSDERLIQIEMEQYLPLIESGCHDNLPFLLCGIFAPFCQSTYQPFVLPCREVCEQVKAACLREYQSRFIGLPWPAKLQCHRYPAGGTRRLCATPDDGLDNPVVEET